MVSELSPGSKLEGRYRIRPPATGRGRVCGEVGEHRRRGASDGGTWARAQDSGPAAEFLSLEAVPGAGNHRAFGRFELARREAVRGPGARPRAFDKEQVAGRGGGDDWRRFGRCSRRTAPARMRARLDSTGGGLGRPGDYSGAMLGFAPPAVDPNPYRLPESPDGSPSPEGDVWALAGVVHFMLLGEPPPSSDIPPKR